VLSAPPRGEGRILNPDPEDASDLYSLKDSPYGPPLTIRAALSLVAHSTIFNDSLLTGGIGPFEEQMGREPETARYLVGQIISHWRAVQDIRKLMLLCGDRISAARNNVQFEWYGTYFPSACGAIQFLAESDLQEAWCVVHDVRPFTSADRVFHARDRMPPFDVDRWYDALPALCRHFTDRGDGGALISPYSKVAAALQQELATLRIGDHREPATADRQQNGAPRLDGTVVDPTAMPAEPSLPTAVSQRQAPFRGELKEPSKDAFAAYRLQVVIGGTQTNLAARLSEELGRPITQGAVSRWLKDVKAWLEAGNVLPDLTTIRNTKPMPMDPERIDLGERRDGRAKRQRGRRNSDDD
jgi:hypothetical protein